MKSTIAVRRTTSLQALIAKDLPKYLAADEVRRVIEQAANPRDRLLMNLLWQTGLRISEALMLTPNHIDFNGAVLKAPTLKRRKPMVRPIPLKSALLGELARHVAAHRIGEHDRLFAIRRTRSFQIIRRACLAAGIESSRSHPHSLRHSFAIACVIQGVPVPVLNAWLGHAGLESTLIYSKVLAVDSRQFHDRMAF
jgi:integrase